MRNFEYIELLKQPDHVFNTRINFYLIINYLLKKHSLSKEEFANRCGISYSRVKKFLRFDKTNFYYEEMLQISSYYKISLHEIENGYLINNTETDDLEFSQKYYGNTHNLFTSGSVCYLHRLNYIRTFGMKDYLKLCIREKIDPIYFVNLKNPCSIDFNFLLGQDARLRGKLIQPFDIEKMATISVESPVVHKKNENYYLVQQTKIGKLNALIEKMGDYEKNCKYSIENWNQNMQYVDISYRYQSHCNLNKLSDPVAGGWIPHFAGYFFKHFSGSKNNPQVIQNLTMENNKCILRIPLQ